jgi:hypothetical protein
MEGKFTHKPMPEPINSSIGKILDAAATEKTVDLDTSEFADVLDKNEEVVERSKTTLDTRSEWQALKTTITNEKGDLARNKDVLEDEGSKRGLETIERHIDESIAAAPEAVVRDIKAEEAEKPGALNTFKKLASGGFFKTVGGMLRALSAVMKILPGSVLGINASQLNLFEGMYNKMFGPSDTRGQVAEALKDSGVVIREGTQDSMAYGLLHTKYEAALRAKLGVDASGKTDKSQIEQDLLKQDFSFQKFIGEEARAYGAKHGGAAEKGKEKATTLMGLAQGASPVEVGAANDPKAAPTKEEDRDITTETLDIRSIPLKRNLLADVDLNNAAATENRLELTSGDTKITILPPIDEEGMLDMRILIDGVPYRISPKTASPDGTLKNAVLTALGIVKTDKGIDGQSALRAAKNGMTVERVGDVVRASVPGIADVDVPLADIERAIAAAKGKPSADIELNITQSVMFTKQTKRETFVVSKL